MNKPESTLLAGHFVVFRYRAFLSGLGLAAGLALPPTPRSETWHGLYTDATSYAPGDTVQAYVSSPPTNGVVRLVRLDEDWTEVVRSGTLTLGPQESYVGSFIEYPDVTLSDRTAFTLEGWVKPSVMGGDTVVVAGQFGLTEAAAAILITQDGLPAAYVSETPATDPARAIVASSAGSWDGWLDSNATIAPWHHLALTYDGTQIRFYVDGNLAGERSQTGPVAKVAAPFRLGARSEAPGDLTGVLDGFLDSWVLWPTALLQTEIEQRVAAGLAMDDPVPDPNTADLYVGFEGPYPSIQDTSGHGHAGHVVNHGNPGVTGVTINGRAFRLNHDEIVDAGWSVTAELTIPPDIPSGMYAVQVLTAPGFAPTPEGDRFYVRAIAIRPAADALRAPIAVVLPSNTWNAYNAWPKSYGPGDITRRSRIPGGALNIGGNNSAYGEMGDGISISYWHGWKRPSREASPLPPASGSGYTVRAPCSMYLVQWLEARGFACDVYSDNDLDAGAITAADYRVLVPNAHHEYWSDEMLHSLTRFLDEGGSVVAVAGNMFGWRVVYDPNGVIEVRKYTRTPIHGLADMHSAIDGALMGGRNTAFLCNDWYAYEGGYSFQAMGVVSHLIHPCEHPPFCFANWAARNAGHWLWRNSGLNEDQRFGFGRAPGSGAVGHETDTWVEGMPLPGLAAGQQPVILAEGVDFGADSGDVNSILENVGRTVTPPSCEDFQLSQIGPRTWFGGTTNSPTVSGTILYFPHQGGGHVLAVGASATPWALWSDASLSGLLYRALGAFAYDVGLGGPPPGAPQALFVVGDLAPLGAADSVIKTRLEQTGYDVIVRDDDACTALDALGKAVILTSASVDPALVNGKFQQVPVPVLNWHPALQPHYRETVDLPDAGFGTLDNQVALQIVDPDHPLAAGLSAGPHIVTTTPRLFGWGFPNAPGLDTEPTIVATAADPNDPDADEKALIYAYDTGARMVGGLAAPRRRVHLFLANNGIAALNPTGMALLDAAFAWAVEVEEPTIPTDVKLGIAPADGQVTLSWPSDRASGFHLESATDIFPGNWTTVSEAVVRQGGTQNTVTVTPGESRTFYRLVHP